MRIRTGRQLRKRIVILQCPKTVKVGRIAQAINQFAVKAGEHALRRLYQLQSKINDKRRVSKRCGIFATVVAHKSEIVPTRSHYLRRGANSQTVVLEEGMGHPSAEKAGRYISVMDGIGRLMWHKVGAENHAITSNDQ